MSKDGPIYNKFNVSRTDGSDGPGGKHEGCEYFVLDLKHDPHAIAALSGYANSCRTSHPQLSSALIREITIRSKAKLAEMESANTEWRWVDEQGRAMTNWKKGEPPPMGEVSDSKGTMRVEVRECTP